MDYIVCSDIHFGHGKTMTEVIIKSFHNNILTETNKELDGLFIGGDLFDRLLDFNSSEVHEVLVFCHQLLEYIYKNGMFLRILEGTPAHDWTQSYVLVKLNQSRKNPCDLKYFRVLDIEYMEKFNKHILYIPDEWVNDHNELERQIQEKLIEHNCQKIDIAILHGQFSYQVKGYKPHFCFKEEYFLNLVKTFIHVGHYHNFNTYDRIIANGSLERLTFGDENPKGYVVVKDGHYYFRENKEAKIYNTYKVTKTTNLNNLVTKIKKLPVNSYIRLQLMESGLVDPVQIRMALLDYIIKFTTENATEMNNVTYIDNETIGDEEFNIESFSIHNLGVYLRDAIVNKYPITDNQTVVLNDYLKMHQERLNA